MAIHVDTIRKWSGQVPFAKGPGQQVPIGNIASGGAPPGGSGGASGSGQGPPPIIAGQPVDGAKTPAGNVMITPEQQQYLKKKLQKLKKKAKEKDGMPFDLLDDKLHD